MGTQTFLFFVLSLVAHLEQLREDESPHLLEVGRPLDLGTLQQVRYRLGRSSPEVADVNVLESE